MASCHQCGSISFGDGPCDQCGHVNVTGRRTPTGQSQVSTSSAGAIPGAPERRTAPKAADAIPPAPGLGPGSTPTPGAIAPPAHFTASADLDGAPARGSAIGDAPMSVKIIGGLVAFVILGLGLAVFASAGDPPEPLAAVDGAIANPVGVLTPSFCSDPRPMTSSPVPSSTDANMFAVFNKVGALRFEEGSNEIFDAHYYDEIYPSLGLASATPTEPTYALCLTAIGNTRDQVCTGYGSGVRFTIYGMDWTANLYQLSTGERVLAESVRPEKQSCPVHNVGASTDQGPDAPLARQTMVNFALPNEFTATHLANRLGNGSSDWCGNPSALGGVGQRATTPQTFLLTGGRASLAAAAQSVGSSTLDVERVTHITCIDYATTPDATARNCPFEGSRTLRYSRGWHTVTVVEAASGAVVASESFDGDTTCPESFDFRDGFVVTLNPPLSETAATWIDATVTAPVEDAEDGAGKSTGDTTEKD